MAQQHTFLKGTKRSTPRLNPQNSFLLALFPERSDPGSWLQISSPKRFVTPNIISSSRLSLNSQFTYSQTHSQVSPVEDPTSISNSDFTCPKVTKQKMMNGHLPLLFQSDSSNNVFSILLEMLYACTRTQAHTDTYAHMLWCIASKMVPDDSISWYSKPFVISAT